MGLHVRSMALRRACRAILIQLVACGLVAPYGQVPGAGSVGAQSCVRSKGASSAGLQPYVAIVYPETGDLVETNFTVFFRVKHFELPAGIHAIAACPALVGSVKLCAGRWQGRGVH